MDVITGYNLQIGRLLKMWQTEPQKLLMLLEHGCLDVMCQPQKLLNFWTSEPQVAYKMLAYIKKCVYKQSVHTWSHMIVHTLC